MSALKNSILLEKHIIQHEIFFKLNEEILTNLQNKMDSSLLLVIGPSGIGKSTFEQYLCAQLSNLVSQHEFSHFGPPIYIEVPVRKKNEFPWRSFFEEILRALGDPDLEQKVNYDAKIKSLKNGDRYKNRSQITLGELESLVIDRIKILKPIAILFDECQGFAAELPASAIKNNLDTLKSWTNKMETRLVLFGTHESKTLLHLNEQLSRRVTPFYFNRYQNFGTDLTEFYKVFKTILHLFDLKVEDKVKDNLSFVYNHSLGCVGLLFDWLSKCKAFLTSKNQVLLTKEIMLEQKLNWFTLEKAEHEIKSFEHFFDESNKEFDPNLVQPDLFDSDNEPSVTRSRRTNRTPGKRKANRDPVRTE